MDSVLSYFLVIQPSGLPVFAQSFEFDSDLECKSFNLRLSDSSESGKHQTMSGYFTSIKMLAGDFLNDKLNLVDLGFSSYEIVGYIENDIFFIGIFGNQDNKTEAYQHDLVKNLGKKFLERYEIKKIKNSFVKVSDFADFSDYILSEINGDVMNCRNCLTKCTAENKGCLPHKFYFDQVNHEENVIILK